MTSVLISDVTMKHETVSVLNRVHLEVRPGEILSILGPSGCGKTTLLRCVAGFERLTSGSIAIGGRPVAATDIFVPPERRDTGFVFQSYALWPHLTVFENIALGLKIRKLPGLDIEQRVSVALKRLELISLRDRFPAQLSGGQQQR